MTSDLRHRLTDGLVVVALAVYLGAWMGLALMMAGWLR